MSSNRENRGSDEKHDTAKDGNLETGEQIYHEIGQASSVLSPLENNYQWLTQGTYTREDLAPGGRLAQTLDGVRQRGAFVERLLVRAEAPHPEARRRQENGLEFIRHFSSHIDTVCSIAETIYNILGLGLAVEAVQVAIRPLVSCAIPNVINTMRALLVFALRETAELYDDTLLEDADVPDDLKELIKAQKSENMRRLQQPCTTLRGFATTALDLAGQNSAVLKTMKEKLQNSPNHNLQDISKRIPDGDHDPRNPWNLVKIFGIVALAAGVVIVVVAAPIAIPAVGAAFQASVAAEAAAAAAAAISAAGAEAALITAAAAEAAAAAGAAATAAAAAKAAVAAVVVGAGTGAVGAGALAMSNE